MSDEMPKFPQNELSHATRATLESGKDGLVGRKLARLDSFEPAVGLQGSAEQAYRRRFTILFVDEATRRRGGIGSVVFATNALGEQFALKTLIVPERDELVSEDEHVRYVDGLKRAFRQEFECHKAVSGLKGFPRLYGAGEVDGVPAIVMEWVRGETLGQAAPSLALDSAGRTSSLVAAQIGRDIFDLLSRLDCIEGGFVHRDISLGNVMLRTSRLSIAQQVEEGAFDVCLIDFGSSAPAQASETSFTRANSVTRKATADFAPPEMLTDDIAGLDELRKSPKIDVYATAGVAYKLACGRAPFDLEDEGGARSAYRVKTECQPASPVFMHAIAADIASALAGEPEVNRTVRRASATLAALPDAEEVRDSLAFVDDQLSDVLMACLAREQQARPSAIEAYKAFASFCGHYLENVERSLKGEPLVPCSFDGAPEGTLRELFATRSVLRIAGTAVSLAAWCAVAVSAGIFANGMPASLNALGISWAGELSGVGVSVALAAPAVVGAAVRGRSHSTFAGFARGSVGLFASALIVAGAFALFSVYPSSAQGSVLAALLASSVAGWCPMALDFALAIPFGPMRAAARAGLPRPNPAGRAGALASGARESADETILTDGEGSHGGELPKGGCDCGE